MRDPAVTVFWIQQRSNQFVTDCFCAGQTLHSRETMRAVKTAIDLHPSSEISHVSAVRRALEDLKFAADRRLEAIMQQHFKVLGDIDNLDDFYKQRAQYMSNDWVHLRGMFAARYFEADRGATELLIKLEKKVKDQTTNNAPGGRES